MHAQHTGSLQSSHPADLSYHMHAVPNMYDKTSFAVVPCPFIQRCFEAIQHTGLIQDPLIPNDPVKQDGPCETHLCMRIRKAPDTGALSVLLVNSSPQDAAVSASARHAPRPCCHQQNSQPGALQLPTFTNNRHTYQSSHCHLHQPADVPALKPARLGACITPACITPAINYARRT